LNTYYDFLKSKIKSASSSGFTINTTALNDNLFLWQKDIVRWALAKGKAALFEDTGLGKSMQQLVWADEVVKHTGGAVMIYAPLSVAYQTQRESEKFGISAKVVREQTEITTGNKESPEQAPGILYSPPFASLYTYSNSDRDLGNSRDNYEFFAQFEFIASELFRVLMPGLLMSVHCMDIPAMKERDGYIRLVDFPGQLISLFQGKGFIYHSRVVIWKDPLIEATRTKAIGLMHKQIVKDSAMCRNGLPDYLLTFRKPGGNPEPVARPEGFASYIGEEEISGKRGRRTPTDKSSPEYVNHKRYINDPVYSHHVWRRYASPVWMDINQTDTLQYRSARDGKDERHICPLQLGVIHRAVELWTNEGDVVLSPFGGMFMRSICFATP
jgi:hypothetical protein